MLSRSRKFRTNKQILIGLLMVGTFVVVALIAPWLAPQPDPTDTSPFKITGQQFQRLPGPPTAESPLGTTPQIRNMPLYGLKPGQDSSYQWDVYYTLIWGTRSALYFGLLVTFLTAMIGITIGTVSGYLGGTAEYLMMRVTDAFLAFPAIAAIWLFQRVFFGNLFDPFMDYDQLSWWELTLERARIDPVMLTLIVFSWMPYARLMNNMVSQIKKNEYVQAAKVMGASGWHIILQHLLPNSISPTVVLAARDVGVMVILACAFIFIGFGGRVAWGIMLVTSRDFVIGYGGNPFVYWWSFVPISLALILFSMGWNFLGDGLNDALNPHRRY
ncbi:MAG: ABC transporter permease [Candidatus Promineifilaceae bacterium]